MTSPPRPAPPSPGGYARRVKRRPKQEWGETIPAVLYADDLATLYGLFHEACERVIVEVGGWDLDSLDDLDKVGVSEARDLRMIGFGPGAPTVILYATRAGFYVYLPDSTSTPLLGLKTAVERLLMDRRVRVAGGISATPFLWASLICAFLSSIAGFPRTVLSAASLVLLGAGFTIGGFHVWVLLRRAGTVYMRPSTASVAGWHVNRDVLLVVLGSVLSAVVLLVVTLVATYVFGVRLP